ncbi:unnamed protein product [Acanthoscelides obtectus]|uniref:Uncharacterized protein n=1 Tax=Acanthoscelides obtectus TaxID=200917 RepID=A0A9P0LXU6_ACAOB|nr:unnamed protein product [Acanthoscelides obtectus]CAK1629276.1 hypothetical protein AOBTE_LOCUS5647 [Acanthoscelides obtectus]
MQTFGLVNLFYLQSRTRRSGKKEEPAVEESEQNINNKRGRNSSIASQSSVKKRRTITYSVEDASEVEKKVSSLSTQLKIGLKYLKTKQTMSIGFLI